MHVETIISQISGENKTCAFGNLILKHGFFCHIVRQGQQVSSKRKSKLISHAYIPFKFLLVRFLKRENGSKNVTSVYYLMHTETKSIRNHHNEM